MSETKQSFEEALAELDKVLNALNAGDIPLEEAIQQYKHGMDMARQCRRQLAQVEGELKILAEQVEAPFQLGGGES